MLRESVNVVCAQVVSHRFAVDVMTWQFATSPLQLQHTRALVPHISHFTSYTTSQRKMMLSLVIMTLALFGVAEMKREPEKPTLPDDEKWFVTKTAFFEVSIDLETAGRVVIALFGDAAPSTVNNFAALAKGNYRGDSKFGYKGTKIHRVVPDFIIQGGDITAEDGTGGKSIYGPFFADEPFYHSHAAAGYVSMANKGTPDTNSSQFFIVMQRTRWLDNKHVVFGKVIEGMEIIEKINQMETDDSGSPKKLVIIEDSGLIKHEPYILAEESR